MSLHKTIELLNNHRLKIYQDEHAESPDVDGNTDIFLVYDHRQFAVRRKGYNPIAIYDYLQTEEVDLSHKYSNYYIFPVYAYIHSGVSLSLASNGDRFDTSMKGFVLVDKNDVDFDLQRKSIEELKDKSNKEIAEYYAKGLIKNWNTYLNGDVYKFNLVKILEFNKIYKDKTIIDNNIYTEEEVLDNMSGFYGTDFTDMLEYIDDDLYNEEIIEQIKNING